MRCIIAGSRTYRHCDIDQIIKDSGFVVTEVVSGHAQGIDRLGEAWARVHGIPLKIIPYLSEYGRAGGPMRNKQMAEYADVLIAIWDGKSRGTQNMISEMQKLNKPIFLPQPSIYYLIERIK